MTITWAIILEYHGIDYQHRIIFNVTNVTWVYGINFWGLTRSIKFHIFAIDLCTIISSIYFKLYFPSKIQTCNCIEIQTIISPNLWCKTQVCSRRLLLKSRLMQYRSKRWHQLWRESGLKHAHLFWYAFAFFLWGNSIPLISENMVQQVYFSTRSVK